jgi:hypothetical protein
MWTGLVSLLLSVIAPVSLEDDLAQLRPSSLILVLLENRPSFIGALAANRLSIVGDCVDPFIHGSMAAKYRLVAVLDGTSGQPFGKSFTVGNSLGGGMTGVV